MSPLLFVKIMVVWNGLLKLMIENGVLKGYFISGSGKIYTLNHLSYAEDILVRRRYMAEMLWPADFILLYRLYKVSVTSVTKYVSVTVKVSVTDKMSVTVKVSVTVKIFN